MFLDMYFQIDIEEYIYINIIDIYIPQFCEDFVNIRKIFVYTIYIVYNYNVFVSTKMYLLRILCICNCIYYDFF